MQLRIAEPKKIGDKAYCGSKWIDCFANSCSMGYFETIRGGWILCLLAFPFPKRQPHFDRLSRIGSHLRPHNVAFVPLLFFLFLSSFYSPLWHQKESHLAASPSHSCPSPEQSDCVGLATFLSTDSHVNLSLRNLSHLTSILYFSLSPPLLWYSIYTLLCSREVSERVSEAANEVESRSRISRRNRKETSRSWKTWSRWSRWRVHEDDGRSWELKEGENGRRTGLQKFDAGLKLPAAEASSVSNSLLSPFRYFLPSNLGPRSILSSFFFSFHHLHPPLVSNFYIFVERPFEHLFRINYSPPFLRISALILHQVWGRFNDLI